MSVPPASADYIQPGQLCFFGVAFFGGMGGAASVS